jgi:hypothetical protein
MTLDERPRTYSGSYHCQVPLIERQRRSSAHLLLALGAVLGSQGLGLLRLLL